MLTNHPSISDLRNLRNIQDYTKRWDKDSSKDTAAHAAARKEDYAGTTNGYYESVPFDISPLQQLFLLQSTSLARPAQLQRRKTTFVGSD